MKKICALILCFAMVVSLCNASFVASGTETYTTLDAVEYASVTRYAEPKAGDTRIGGIVYPDTQRATKYLQSFESLNENGLTDITNTPYITYSVEAEEAGEYSIGVRFILGGTVADDYNMTVGVNDKLFYKGETVSKTGTYEHFFTVTLEKGVNIIRCITFTSDNYHIFKNHSAWLDYYSLKIGSGLSGVKPSNKITVFPGNTEYHGGFNEIDANAALRTIQIWDAKDRGLTYENMRLSDVDVMPYYSLTVDAPYSGYYDISAKICVGIVGQQGYITVFVDKEKSKHNVRDIYDTNNPDDRAVSWYTEQNLSVYIPAGTHTVTVTSALGYEQQYYRDWCDMSAIVIKGVTLSANQVDPASLDNPYVDVVPYAIRNRYPETESGGTVIGGIQYPSAEEAKYMQSFASLKANGFAERKLIPHLTFLVKAEKAGTYYIAPYFNLGCSTDITTSYKMTLDVNDKYFYQGDEVKSRGWHESVFKVELEEGVNIVRCLTMTSDYYNVFKDSKVWLNYRKLRLSEGLSLVSPGETTTFKAGATDYHGGFALINADKDLKSIEIKYASQRGLTYDNMVISDIDAMPFFSVTVDAPYTGYYDMSVEAYCGIVGKMGYMTVFVDKEKSKHNFLDTKGTTWATANISVYMTAGTHCLTVTSVLGHESQFYRDWCDMGTVRINGATISSKQINPASFDNTYINCVKYATPSRYTTVEGGNIIGGMVYPNYDKATKYMQSLSSLNSNGFMDKTEIPHITYAIKAERAGTYNIAPQFYIGGSAAINYKLTLGVNDKKFYQSAPVTSTGWYEPTFKVQLEEGVNIIRCMTITSDTLSQFKDNKVWVNYKDLRLSDELTAIPTGNKVSIQSGRTTYHGGFGNITGAGGLSSISITNASSLGFTFDNLELGNMGAMPFTSVTVDAPYSGYYDISLEACCGIIGATGYFTVFVDNDKYKRNFMDIYDLSSSNKETGVWYTTHNVSVYIPEGTHTVTITAALGHSTTYYRDWCDMGNITIDRVTLAPRQTDPQMISARENMINYEAESSFIHSYETVLDASCSGGKYITAKSGRPFDITFNPGYPNETVAYAAFAVNSPTTANCCVQARVRLNCDKDAFDAYVAKYRSFPYMTIMANGMVHMAQIPVCNQFVNVDFDAWEFKKGNSLMYVPDICADVYKDLGGAHIDIDNIGIQEEMQISRAVMYRMGDVNADNYVDIKDLLRMKLYIADNSKNIAFRSADLNPSSSSINADDLAVLKRAVLEPTNTSLTNTAKVNLEYSVADTVTAVYSGVDEKHSFKDVTEAVNVYSQSELKTSDGSVIYITPTTKYQDILGFGAALTDSSCYLLDIMPYDESNKVMEKLFDSENGFGYNLLRQPCGVTDFSMNWHTYDDMPEGQRDDNLTHFSIDGDKDYIIPRVKQAMELSGDMKVVSAIWSPPCWMKKYYNFVSRIDVGNTYYSNALKDDCYDVLAKYIAKFIKAYTAEGIPIYAFTPQNEPTGVHYIPATYYSSANLKKLYQKTHDEFVAQGINTQLWGWEFNWFKGQSKEYIDACKSYINAISYHDYVLNERKDIFKTLLPNYPTLPIHISEGGTSAGIDRSFQGIAANTNDMVFMLRNRLSSVIKWCVILDQFNGPADPREPHRFASASSSSNGVAYYNTDTHKLAFSSESFMLGHFSKFMKRGSKVIASTDSSASNSALSNVATLNPDGTVTVVISNAGSHAQTFKIVLNNKVVEYRLPKCSVATINWQYK